ncbi:MAG TPA: histidinol phosphate phosphatase domain-containing protein [Chloroflexota bacterium]|nr:histidinol phosphate phosphatase domain-containing protein [Chloroflexota bacterium]
MLYDFHCHTFLSDGELSPVELIRRASVRGYRAIGVADHVGIGGYAEIIRQVSQDCVLCARYWKIVAVPAVEITHVPPPAIAEVARACKEAGARIVIVHGETPVEPVEPGTNRAAVHCPDVDVLGHPGFLSQEEVEIAAANGVFFELTPRRGHSITNGHVARIARSAGVRLIVNSDGHSPGDLLTEELARRVALGAGLDENEADIALHQNPRLLLERVGVRLPD